MIQKFVDRFMENKPEIEAKIALAHPSYEDLVRFVVEAISDSEDYGSPDPTRIHAIDDGDYQGTLLYVIADNSYQPSVYWYTMVDYGSCSGCDTLQSICNYDDEAPSASQVADYMTLALHIVQKMREMYGKGSAP